MATANTATKTLAAKTPRTVNPNAWAMLIKRKSMSFAAEASAEQLEALETHLAATLKFVRAMRADV